MPNPNKKVRKRERLVMSPEGFFLRKTGTHGGLKRYLQARCDSYEKAMDKYGKTYSGRSWRDVGGDEMYFYALVEDVVARRVQLEELKKWVCMKLRHYVDNYEKAKRHAEAKRNEWRTQ